MQIPKYKNNWISDFTEVQMQALTYTNVKHLHIWLHRMHNANPNIRTKKPLEYLTWIKMIQALTYSLTSMKARYKP